MSQDNNQVDLDSLLDATLDDLADLPEFKIFPAGAYTGTIELLAKKMGDNPGVELKFTLIETNELSDPTQEVPANGATTSVGFLLNNEFGQGELKNVLTAIKSGLNVTEQVSNRELIEMAKGSVCMCVFSTRADKKDTTKVYQQLKSLTVV